MPSVPTKPLSFLSASSPKRFIPPHCPPTPSPLIESLPPNSLLPHLPPIPSNLSLSLSFTHLKTRNKDMKGTLETPPIGEEGGGGGGLQEDVAKKRSHGLQNHLELRLGISFNNGVEDMVTSSTSYSEGKGSSSGGNCSQNPSFFTTSEGLALHQRSRLGFGGSTRWFSETRGGFIDPWSLAGRQEKAVLEQAHQKLRSPFAPRASHPPTPTPVVGWPPIRTFRKNVVASQPPKSEMDDENNANKAKPIEGEDVSHKLQSSSTMYVKVNIEGFAIGRKIDLKAHNSYDSLSSALQKMFHNFLSANPLNNSKHDEGDEIVNSDYILLYQDNEGDCLLVGDVPWEMFITSVKRLYIVHDHRTPKRGIAADGRMEE